MENIRHEFREAETRLELRFKNGATLYAIWPVEDEPFFYLEHIEGMQPRTISVVREYYSTIGIVPTLTPIEHSEKVLSANHIEDNLSTRLVSRHFRNQLLYVKSSSESAYEELVSFMLRNTPEIEGLDLQDSYDRGDRVLDLYFSETSSHTQKELYWAGDGLQIWLQVLFHMWRQKDLSTVVLDEPDVFLHPDLQRRLVRLLEENERQQIIMATHAPEMLAEASRDSVIIVDRTRRRSRRVTDERVLADLNDVLGSGFNLRLARALRARVALFVEGKDMKVLRNVARTVGADRVRTEQGLAIVPMEGFSRWRSAASFAWVNDHLLDNAVKTMIILDRDYRTDGVVHDLVEELKVAGVEAHVWAKKELESYLLDAETIARLSGSDAKTIEAHLDSITTSLKTTVFARYLDERLSTERAATRHGVSITEHYTTEFDKLWEDPSVRLAMAPPKEILHNLNGRLQSTGFKAVSVRSLSQRIPPNNVPAEMRNLLLHIDSYLAPVGSDR